MSAWVCGLTYVPDPRKDGSPAQVRNPTGPGWFERGSRNRETPRVLVFFPGFFLDSVFSRLTGTFNVGLDGWGRRCWTVFYVTPENICR